MTLPLLPEPAMVHMDAQGYSTPCYTSEQMLKFRADTVEACAKKAEEAVEYYWPSFPESSGASLLLRVAIRGLLI